MIDCPCSKLFHLIGKQSGHTRKEIEEHFLRDRFMNAIEAKAFGLIDEVLGDTSDIVVVGPREFNVSLFANSLKKSRHNFG